MQIETASGRNPSITMIISVRDPSIATMIEAAGKGGIRKRKSSNERRTHSCALLGRPHNIKVREKGAAGRDGYKISLCSENSLSDKNKCNLKL